MHSNKDWLSFELRNVDRNQFHETLCSFIYRLQMKHVLLVTWKFSNNTNLLEQFPSPKTQTAHSSIKQDTMKCTILTEINAHISITVSKYWLWSLLILDKPHLDISDRPQSLFPEIHCKVLLVAFIQWEQLLQQTIMPKSYAILLAKTTYIRHSVTYDIQDF